MEAGPSLGNEICLAQKSLYCPLWSWCWTTGHQTASISVSVCLCLSLLWPLGLHFLEARGLCALE